MKHPYELIYGYQHCMGRTLYSAGYVAFEATAEQWVRERTGKRGPRVMVPTEDPVCWCPVSHCHMKRQRPWFGYRSGDGALNIKPSDERRVSNDQEHHGP